MPAESWCSQIESLGKRGSGHVLVDAGRESSVFMTGLSLKLRGSWVVSTVVAAGIPSVAEGCHCRGARPRRRWSRHDGVMAGSGCDGPVCGAAVFCREAESLLPRLWRIALFIENVDVEGSILAGLDM